MTHQFHAQIPVTEVDLGPGVFAFFTSGQGGVSQWPYSSLNLGSMVGDSADNVAANRTLVEHAAGKPVVFARQVHSNHAETISSSTLGAEREPEADALATMDSSIGLAVYVADCVPVLLADATQGIVATAHAGRPGLLSRVISSAVDQMLQLGAEVTSIRAAIGPSICANCYEIPPDLAVDFARHTGTQVHRTQWDSSGIDLQSAARTELMAAGISKITVIPECTYEHAGSAGNLFSHRWATHNAEATQGKSGRFAGVISLKNDRAIPEQSTTN